MKRFFIFIACFTAILISVAESAASVTKVIITTKEPMMGEKISHQASVPETASTQVYDVKWSGEFENGRFVQGNDYTLTVKLRIKASSSNVFAPASKINATINGHKGKVSVVREYKAISVKYTWKELGGPNPDNPKTKLRTRLAELAAAYTARNTDDDKVLMAYLKKELPEADIWHAGGSYKYRRVMPTETADGRITVSIGITYDGVTLEGHNFSVVLPALSKSPAAAKLAADLNLMKTALDNYPVTAKTTVDEVLAAANAAAINGSTAVWEGNYQYNAPTSTVRGSIEGKMIIALGDNKDYLRVHKSLPINGSAADAAIDADFSALSKALHNQYINNGTTQEDLINVASAAIKNGSRLSLVSFTKTDATYYNEGKIVICFELTNKEASRSPRISMKLSKLRPPLPKDISINDDEWEILRLTNKERYKNGAGTLVMIPALQDAGDIRAEEIVIVMRRDHLRPDGRPYHTAIDPKFTNGGYTGENCVKHTETPAQSITAWMESDGHRKNMLNSIWAYFGAGMHKTSDGKKHWVQLFTIGNGVIEAETNTGSFHFNTVADMENAYLICKVGEGVNAYVPLDEDYMFKKGNQYTIHLMGKSVTVTVGK